MAFFENFGKMVSDTYKSAAKASGKLFEEGKLRFMISDNESQMKEIFQTIGKEYCESYFRGEQLDNEKYENEYEELKRMQIENDQAREKILELKNIRKCINCEKEINITHVYCENCGTKQPEIKEEEEDKKEEQVPIDKVCKNCEAKIGTDDKFCPFCGTSIE